MSISRLILVASLLSAVAHAQTPTPATTPVTTIELSVDLTDTPRRIFHARERVPVTPGKVTLVYPKWLPGEHAPNGPITELAGLVVKANGKPLAWRRDPVDMFAIHVDAPSSPLEVTFDYLGLPEAEGFSGGSSTTAQIGILEWNQVVLYPAGVPARDLRVRPSLKLPAGWKLGTALTPTKGAPSTFEPVSLETLVDSPVIFGAHFKSVPLQPGTDPPHFVDLAADGAEALALKPEQLKRWNALVAETGALFGARHYLRYHFLLGLSDHLAHFGLEHHQSSDNRTWERALLDPEIFDAASTLLPHEFTHSWNGKYRRPEGLVTSDFQQPMKGELLWVYEGLTDYLGVVLAARSGRPMDWSLDDIAAIAAGMDTRSGRRWRSVGDTALAAQLLYGSGPAFTNWRRSVDFYPEGLLVWLEADTIIRETTHGARSLDDFCKRFFGGTSGPPAVVPYTRADLVRTLGEVAPYDWAEFFNKRIDGLSPHAPLGGITGAGFELVYDDKPNKVIAMFEKLRKVVSVAFSLGFWMNKDGVVMDVDPDSPSGKAGLAPGTKLIGVNGRTWSPERLLDVLDTKKPITLTVENGTYLETLKLTYAGGPRFPHLKKLSARPDLMSDILKGRAIK
jgi:predicted metalloprotease with PDZ domain